MLLTLKANPGAPQSRLKRYENGILYVDIKAPAQDGKANTEVIRFLAKLFQTSAADIKIISGSTGRIKKIKLPIEESEILKALSET